MRFSTVLQQPVTIVQPVTPVIPDTLIDSGPVAPGLGVYTTLIDPTPAGCLWFQLKITAAAGGSLQLALGAAGFEVNILHWSFNPGTTYDVGNLPFSIPGGQRLSIIPTVNLTNAEAHIYYKA